MKICGTNLVPIFITMVFCGFIFVYFNMRLAEVKSSIEKQNRVLTAFITNVQNDIRSGGMMFGACAMGSGECVMKGAGAMGAGTSVAGTGLMGASVAGANHLASEEALQAVRRNEKIVVSDDEDDDDDDDSDEESDSEDSDDESGSDSDDEEDDTKISIIPSAISQDSSVVSLELISDNLTLDFESLPAMTSLDSSSAILIQDSLKIVDLDATQTDATTPADVATPADAATPLDVATHSDAAKTDIIYESMKVDDLRKIVADLNLAVKDEAKKLKKPELLALLKK